MAIRTFLHLGDAASKCVFTTVYKPKLHTFNICKQIRSFKSMKDAKGTSVKLNTIVKDHNCNASHLNFSRLWRPLGFTVMVSGVTFVTASICEYERVRDLTFKTINRYKYYYSVKKGWRREWEIWWQNLKDHQKIFIGIAFINALVYLAWCVPSFQPAMNRFFCANPASKALCWPMILSVFSHRTILHLSINMYVLYSFSGIAMNVLGMEQFLGLYFTSGVVANFTSYLYKIACNRPIGSIGASGAIMGILGYVSTIYPNAEVTLILLPFFTFTLSTAMKAVIIVDVIGCYARWSLFDHAAHLGGAFLGMCWGYWGEVNIWQKRILLLKYWNDFYRPK